MISLSKIIPKVYHNVFTSNKSHIWLSGGRGSGKSSFACLDIIYRMTVDAKEGRTTHCVALRKVHNTIMDSIYSNLVWAINILQLNNLWKLTVNPLKLQCGDNTILFRGCANLKDFEKIKSIKFNKGSCQYAIYEELTEFDGMEEINSINQSLFRGTDQMRVFYMYNPPASKSNWVNVESKVKTDNRLVHKSTYLDIPKEYLGKIFIKEAENMKKINLRKYQHVYLAKEIGEGIEIYKNLVEQSITEDQINSFPLIKRGIDFGFTEDATAYVECYYDKKEDAIYIFKEVYGHRMSNLAIKEAINHNYFIYADSAEPRTISELATLGLNIKGAKKGKDSMRHGIKWLQDLNKIVIDKKRSPNAFWDFDSYEYKKDGNGNIIYDYPKETHASAATRYALSDIIQSKKLVWGVTSI